MYFTKYPYIENFSFTNRYTPTEGFCFQTENRPVTFTEDDQIFRLTVKGGPWEVNDSSTELAFNPGSSGSGAYALTVAENGCMKLTDSAGHLLLSSFENRPFGKSGAASAFVFNHRAEFRYYGMGSKLLGLELSGVQTKCWNTDAFADFGEEMVREGRPDPYYVSIPYLIVKTPHGWVGMLYNNAHATFVSLGAEVGIEGFERVDGGTGGALIIGAESGQPDLFLLAAASLPELTRLYQQLVGCMPLPPLWALGYQQCRWGYESIAQLEELEKKFIEHDIPVDGLWLDIDYMDGFRVFTMDEKHIPNPDRDFQELLDRGHPVIPIIDPGVKKEEGYRVYDDGKDNDVFCKNPEGGDFTGLVWPGKTVFPDFSREEVRHWWAGYVEKFASHGIIGAWLDMNDPSVGSANPCDMLWGKKGERPHEAWHNQYGKGMAQATKQGFERAHPNRRPFLLTRSNYTGGQKYAAVFTGDSTSSYHYLKLSIPTTLNLALSGMPCNGGDIGGFDSDTNPRLLRDWIKAGCLMPFCRNHSSKGSIHQEPWVFDELTLAVNRDFIRLRYTVMPYLYNLFVEHAKKGEAVVRPLFYDFESTADMELDRVEDQFMVGPSIMQAPFLEEGGRKRDVILPGPQRWFDISTQNWFNGAQHLRDVPCHEHTSPIYLREGTVIPIARELKPGLKADLRKVDFLLMCDVSSDCVFTYSYTADDGYSLRYQHGEHSELYVSCTCKDGALDIRVNQIRDGYGEMHCGLLLFSQMNAVLNGKHMKSTPESLPVAGTTLDVFRLHYS